MSRNLAASVRARLKQHADATKQDFNLTLTHYGLERLLYRLSVSDSWMFNLIVSDDGSQPLNGSVSLTSKI
jgi:hypothetical protein